MSEVIERSLTPELSLVDVQADLLWHRDGRVSVVYELASLHEPGMSDDDFDRVARLGEDVWSGLPEGTEYQFLVLVDARRGARRIEEALPPIPDLDERSRCLEELRQGRLAELVREGAEDAAFLVQERRHFFAASFRPSFRESSTLAGLRERVRGWVRRGPRAGGKYERAYEGVLQEAATFGRRIEIALSQLGLGFTRCHDEALVRLLYDLLNPTLSRWTDMAGIPERPRVERASLDERLVKEAPWLGDASPLWSLHDDDLAVRREYLRIGADFVSVLSLKQLPDTTEPGVLVPLLHLARGRYRVSFRVDIPRLGVELAALRAKATLADGLQLQNFLVRSDRKDAQALAVAKESDEAMERVIASTQRIVGTSLQIVLHEASPDSLDEAVQEVVGVLSRAHGLRAVRETYRLKEAWLSVLPGSPPMDCRRRRTLTPVASDMMPIYDFRTGTGKVPFLTPTRSLVLYDPFDTRVLPNANILVTGTSGAGKSFLVSLLVSGYEIGAAAQGEPPPYVFILDNGASYKRYAELRPDGRYVLFGFDRPPGVDPFAWSAEEGDLDEHVSRLEWLLLDLLHVDPSEEERFERVKAVLEAALYSLYASGGEASFAGLGNALEALGRPEAEALTASLYPFVRGKFRRLCEASRDLEMTEDVHLLCYDFHGLAEHRDLASLALRLAIYQVRRWAARVSRKGHRTFLVLDESWALLDAASGGAIAGTAAPFIAASVRMGRKEGMSVVGLSQVIEDFAQSAYGAAIVGNSATKFVGQPGGEGVEGLRRHLRLTDRQVDQVRRLKRTQRFHEFLLMQGDLTHVVRVPGDPLSRWIFTTSPRDRERLAALAKSRPDLSLLEQVRLLAASGEA